MKHKRQKFLIGIDEAGRGPLAGPVFVAALGMTVSVENRNLLKGIKDSKKLSRNQRDKWFNFLTKNKKILWAAASAGPKVIDKINISNAANLAATRALKKLIVKYKIPNARYKVLLDGGLYIRANPRIYPRLSASTIVKGDEKIPVIAAASIIAKVTRDRLMERLHKKYPRYGFNIHKAYGTKMHLERLKKYGASPVHRLSFKPVFNATSFKEKVYYLVSKIPKGETRSYKEIAKLAGKSKAYRAVGNILNKNYDKKILYPVRSSARHPSYILKRRSRLIF